jgi:hypothetical protein
VAGVDDFLRMVKEFSDGETDAIIMHIDTAKLLERGEWELLKQAGATVMVIHKQLPDSAT